MTCAACTIHAGATCTRRQTRTKPFVHHSLIAPFVVLTNRFGSLRDYLPKCRRIVRVCGVDGGFAARALSARFSGLKL